MTERILSLAVIVAFAGNNGALKAREQPSINPAAKSHRPGDPNPAGDWETSL